MKDLNRQLKKKSKWPKTGKDARNPITREIQIKTIRYYYTPPGCQKLKTLTISSADEDVEQQELSLSTNGNGN